MTECQIPPEPEIGGIGNWEPCFKPGPCPCSSPCAWVAPLNSSASGAQADELIRQSRSRNYATAVH
jgi:hypothetical protein